MAKRFTDTEKWKKPFIRSLKAPYKLLWLYVCDDCDHAGIWQVDLEVAEIRIGIKLNLNEAIKSYGDKIIVFDNGNKWFIPSFIEFQYPSGLNPQNNAHIGIIKTLEKYQLEINQIKPLNSPLTAPMDMVMDKDKVKDKDKVIVILPFESENFYNYWNLWKDYKYKQLNFKFKTPQSEQASLKDLVTLSNGDEQTAIKIIEQSMAKGWKGLFALKNEIYAAGISQGSKPNFTERQEDALRNLR